MKTRERLSRRKFIIQAACGAGALGTLKAFGAKPAESANAFAYDMSKYARTDPKLLAYEEVGRFSAACTEPRRISFGADQRLHIAGAHGVTTLGADGEKVSELAVRNARCVVRSPDGKMYVGLRDHIEVYDAKGRLLKAWETPAKKTWFTGLAVGANDLFVADSANRVVLRFDLTGKLLGRIGEKNKERNVPGLIVPSPYVDVAMAPDGLLRVNNPGRHRVELYTPDGDLEGFWGKPSAAIEGFCGCCNPIALALLPDGRYVTCEKGLPRVKVYSTEGKFESVVAGPESFPQNAKAGSAHDLSDGTMGGLDAAVSPSGTVFILDLVVGDVRVMKRKAQV